VTKFIRGTGMLAVCLAMSVAAAGEDVRLVPVFRAGGIYEIRDAVAHDLDGDGKPELVACSRNSPMAVRAEGETYSPAWYAAGAGCDGGLAAGDLDGDGGAEVLTAHLMNVLIFDPRTLSGPRTTLTIPGSTSIGDIAVGNVDEDAAREIVVVTSGAAYVFDGVTGELQWTATGYGGFTVAIGDVDGDARPEIVVSGSTGYVLDAVAEVQKWGYVGGFGSVWTLGNVDADAKHEIIFRSSNTMYILNGDTFETSSWPTDDDVAALSVADANQDGTRELVAGEYYGGTAGLNPATGAELWRISGSSYDTVRSVGSVDFDGDGVLEVFRAAQNGLSVGHAGTTAPQWTSYAYYGPYDSAFGDLDGDGHLEYVIGAYQGPYSGGAIEVFDSRTHASLGTLTLPSYSNYLAAVAVGQLDNDPALEIAALAGYSSATLYVWDGVTRQIEFTSNSSGTLGTVMMVQNIDGDAVDEIIVGTTDLHVLVLNGASNIIQKSISTSGTPNDFAIADLNADGKGELVVGMSNNVTVYDTTSWAVLGSQAGTWISDVDATSAGGGTVAIAADYSTDHFRLFKGAALTPSYTCVVSSARLTFANAGGEDRLVVADNSGNFSVYPLGGDTCPDVTSTFGTWSVSGLKSRDVTGDGRAELIIDAWGTTAVALFGLSSEPRGDIDGDESITSDDIDDAVDYLFGAQPGISPSADTTADERVSPEDIFLLINYEFAGGAAPQP
jgi:hypothetical protein